MEEKLILDGAIEKLINYNLLKKSEKKVGKTKTYSFIFNLTKSQLESILRIVPSLKNYFSS
jgi:hypothetical protein